MATKIAEIKNLTNGKKIEDEAKLAKFNSTAFSDTITNTDATAADWGDFKPADNIQVIWKNAAKVVGRGVGGTFSKSGKNVTISGLKDASKFNIDLRGQIEIGPETRETGKPPAALVSVRMGNIITSKNPKGDMLIDFSDQTDGAPGSSIQLIQLVDWIKGKAGSNAQIEYPKMGEGDNAPTPEEYLIEFKDFYFNITQKTFDFNVESADSNEVTFGNFTIKKVGFRVTNAPVTVGAIEE